MRLAVVAAARRLAGHPRDRADPSRHRPSATSSSATSWPATPGRTRSQEFVEKPSADVAAELPRRRRLPLERRHVRGPPGVLLDLLGARHPEFAATLRDIAADRPGSRSSGRPCRGSRSTTPSPSPPRRPAGSCGAGVVRLGRHRRLRLAGHPARPDGAGRRTGPRRPRPGAGRSTPPAWSCPAADGRSPSSASTTSSSSTPPTRCWSPPAAARRRSRRCVDRLQRARARGRPHLRRRGLAHRRRARGSR